MFDYKNNVEDARAMYEVIYEDVKPSIRKELSLVIRTDKDKVRFLEAIDKGLTDKEVICEVRSIKRLCERMECEKFYWLYKNNPQDAMQRLTYTKVTKKQVALMKKHKISPQLFYNVYMYMLEREYVKTEQIIEECIKMFAI